ncbi:YhcH/YjgK/YiaL family protein [Clostridium magnum]|uniref:Toxin-antitoxin biofilm protein TabA n=1 Tax=Clostridium magnum DSM 2767 TaxID=1121326 RepID=A0A161X737_9CLOT|nr:YhcH/YjgK/YiaL family protein [Clostridium magnum]KZL89906.1 toxin-antitoxin biofilm protein TabA [Clostridium magnum DSM 2767]SHI45838.1 YhcH/YjgK/YiaL family protein [Clostridium magnum DSM 2767]
MILDKIENSKQYFCLNSNLEKAFKFLVDNNFKELADGRYEIDSDNVYALVQSYTTKDCKDNKWESHEKYIDIQYIASGEETIVWTPVKELTISENLLEERDVIFYNETNYFSDLNLKEGYFGIFFPEDGHKPCFISNKPAEIKKVVLKVKA